MRFSIKDSTKGCTSGKVGAFAGLPITEPLKCISLLSILTELLIDALLKVRFKTAILEFGVK